MMSLEGDAELERLERECNWVVRDHLRAKGNVWVSASSPPETAFGDEETAAVAEVAEGSWWFQLRNRLLIDLIDQQGRPDALWEIGSGTGVVSLALAMAGLATVAVEPGRAGAEQAVFRGQTSIAATLDELGLPASCLPGIGLFDVIEHLERPEGLLTECRRVLAPGAPIFLTVPAYAFLWNDADVHARHFRRYRPREVRRLLTTCGFEVTSCGSRMASLVPPMLVVRSLPYRLGKHRSTEVVTGDLDAAPPWIAGLLHLFERDLGRLLPFGASVFASAVVR
jgi:SAM-dependent methyltransferase